MKASVANRNLTIFVPVGVMSLAFWFTSRQIREALKAGNPEAAQKLIEPYVQSADRHAIKLVPEVARGFARRGEAHLAAERTDAAWKDLLCAESFNVQEPLAVKLRNTLTSLGAAECRAALLAGKPLPVIELIGRLKTRAAQHPDFATYESVARDWLLVMEMADRGDFAAALGALHRAKALVAPELHAGFDRYETQLVPRAQQYRLATDELSAAADAQHWPEVLRWADAITAIAPDHREVRQLRSRAWDVIQSQVVEPVVELSASRESGERAFFAETLAYPAPATAAPVVEHMPIASALPSRFLLWIDGVGGYLVCLGQRVGFGQATATQPVDVPLFADVSRLHAELTRDGEGYILESGRELLVNGTNTKRAILAHGDRVTLGSTCQFVFQLPVPISPSARLELVSGHRLPLAVDGVFLMAENLILGATAPAHVLMPDAITNAILYRSKVGIGMKYDGRFTVDKRVQTKRAILPIPCSVVTDSVSFALEPVGLRL